MIKTLKEMNKSSVAIISNMSQPLGLAVGNALEVAEAIAVLKGEGPADLKELCLVLGAYMLLLGKKTSSVEEGLELQEKAISSGKALAKFEELVVAQGGDSSCIESARILPRSIRISRIHASQSGYITKIDAEKVGSAALELGAGRVTKESKIDAAAGVVLSKKVGDHVTKGDKLAEIHTNRRIASDKIECLLREAFLAGPAKPQPQSLVYDTIRSM